MRINIPYAGFGLALLVFSHQTAAQELELDTFVRSILKNNPGVQKILADKTIAAGALESSQGVDDGVLSSSLSLAHSEPNQVLGFEASQSDDVRLNLAYDRQFSTSGTRLNLSYGNQYTDRNPPLGTLGEQYYQPSFTDFVHYLDTENARCASRFTARLTPRPDSAHAVAGVQELKNCNFFDLADGRIHEMLLYYTNPGSESDHGSTPTGYPGS